MTLMEQLSAYIPYNEQEARDRALLLECPKYESKRAVRYALKKAPTDDKGDENSAARKSYYPLRESGLQGGKSKKHAPF